MLNLKRMLAVILITGFASSAILASSIVAGLSASEASQPLGLLTFGCDEAQETKTQDIPGTASEAVADSYIHVCLWGCDPNCEDEQSTWSVVWSDTYPDEDLDYVYYSLDLKFEGSSVSTPVSDSCTECPERHTDYYWEKFEDPYSWWTLYGGHSFREGQWSWSPGTDVGCDVYSSSPYVYCHAW
jgi:hypothetical protein